METDPCIEQIKAKFIEISTPFIHQINGKLVSSLNDILKQSNTKFKPHKFESKFKADMLEKWNDEFNIMWEANKLTERLTTLNALKQQQQQTGTIGKSWRAHGHTAEEQTQLNRNRRMSIHLSQLQEMLEEQSNDLKKLVFEVEERRSYFNNLSKRRSRIIGEMDAKIAQLRSKSNEVQDESETEETM